MIQNNPKQMPNDEEMEQSLIGMLVKYGNLFGSVAGRLKPGYFFNKKCEQIFRAMSEIYNEGKKTIELPTVMEQLLKTPGNTVEPYDLAVTSDKGVSSNIDTYADTIAALYRRRSVWGVAQMLAGMSVNLTEPLERSVERCLAQLAETMSGVGESDIITLRNAYDMVLEIMEQNKEGNGSQGFLTGIGDIDEYGGLARGTLSVIAGRPSNGKSALAMNMVRLNAANGKTVVYFSLEMTCERLASRVIAGTVGISSNRIMGKALEKDDALHVIETIIQDNNTISDHILFDHSYNSGYEPIVGKIRELCRSREIGGVVIDYLQQMSKTEGGREQNEAKLLGDMAHGLQKLAVELNLPIVILSQLNRNSTTTGDGTPRLSDLRGSGAIEEAADNVFLLHRPEAEGRGYSGRYSDIDPHNTAMLICAKARNGESGRDYFLAFDPLRTTFSPLPNPPHLSAIHVSTAAQKTNDEFGGLFG